MHEPYLQVIKSLFLAAILAAGLIIYNIIYKKKINLFFLLILISILPIISIFRSGTYEAGDLTLHSTYLQSFYESLQEGIFIPQWAGGLCGGYGCPIFMFEYVLPFYIGAVFHFLNFSYLDSIKLFLASSFILSGITMYIFIKDSYGKIPAFVAAILYLFAPIHLSEMHFRVSVGTQAAFIFVPLVFFFAKKSLEGKTIFIILGAINVLLLILSHSSISLIAIPGALIYAFLIKKNLKEMTFPIFSFILGFGLSAYYMLPAIFEIKYTWYSQTINGMLDFKPFLEYIYSPAYGLLFQDSQGALRLIVGYVQLFIIAFALFSLFKQKYQEKEKKLLLFLLLFFSICFLLMQEFTKPIWQSVFFLRSFVLPWRLLIPLAFIIAFLGAIVVKNWKKKFIIIFCALTILTTILNWGNRKMVPISPNAYIESWILYTEYFEANNPLLVTRYYARVVKQPEIVLHRPLSHLEILEGKGEEKEINRTQITHEYILNAQTNIVVSENTYYFPGWKVFIDGKETAINIINAKRFGSLTFSLPKGLHIIQAKWEDTPIRKTGKTISAISLLIIVGWILIDLWYKIFQKRKPLKKQNKHYRSTKHK